MALLPALFALLALAANAQAKAGSDFWQTWEEVQQELHRRSLAAGTKPNIIFILLDDADQRLGTANKSTIPKTHALIKEQGADLSNYFVNFAVCCPSRVSYLTGRCSHNSGVVWNAGVGYTGGEYRFLEQQLENQTFAYALQQQGYRTGLFGKYLNGYGFTLTDPATGQNLSANRVPLGWEEWWSFKNIGYFNYTASVNGTHTSYGALPEEYSTDVISNQTTASIRRYATDPRPFFLYVAPYAPHSPFVPAYRHDGLLNGTQVPRTPNFLGNYLGIKDKASALRLYPKFQDEFVGIFDFIYQKRLETQLAVDDLVESIVNELDAQGILNNTYIIFTADNGYRIGHHRQPGGKTSPYEEDVHLFLFARGPGITPNLTLPHLTGNIDVALTIADLAGVQFPLNNSGVSDGISFAPLLVNATLQAKDSDHFRAGFLIEKIATDSQPTFISPQVAGEGLVGDVFAKYRRPNKYYYDDSGFTPATQRTIGKTERQYYANLVNKGAELTEDGKFLLNTTYGNTEGYAPEGWRYFSKFGYNNSFSDAAVGNQFPSTYYALRVSNKYLGDFLYVETRSGHEAYNITTDFYQLKNIFTTLPNSLITYFQTFLDHLKTCRGSWGCNPRAYQWPAARTVFP